MTVTAHAEGDRLQAQTCIGSQARANDEDMQLCALHRDMSRRKAANNGVDWNPGV